jgi:FkbM family methyltransferase
MQKSELSMGLGRGAHLIAQSGALTSPLTLIDIGARDGIHRRWAPLTAVLDVYGYDASVQVTSNNPRHHYIKAAIGDYDGEARIELHNGYEAKVSSTGSITVAMYRLDTLYARGDLPKADFIKVDCEGYEPEILRGAQAYLAASCPWELMSKRHLMSVRHYLTRISVRCSTVSIDTILSSLISHLCRPPALRRFVGQERVTLFLRASSQNFQARI